MSGDVGSIALGSVAVPQLCAGATRWDVGCIIWQGPVDQS